MDLIILGGGSSKKEGINKGLWDIILNKYVLGLNYSFNFFPNPTIQIFADVLFYQAEMDDMAYLPLIIGKEFDELKGKTKPNTIMIPSSVTYDRAITDGIYKANLCGIYALTLAIYLLDVGNIYCLGYDFGAINNEKDSQGRAITHSYQGEIEHRGVGLIRYYNNIKRKKEEFKVYEKETKVEIYNVSLNSNINNFTKISYDEFFDKLDKTTYDQDKLRVDIKNKLKEKGYV